MTTPQSAEEFLGEVVTAAFAVDEKESGQEKALKLIHRRDLEVRLSEATFARDELLAIALAMPMDYRGEWMSPSDKMDERILDLEKQLKELN